MMRIGLDVGSTTLKCVVLNEQNEVLFKKYERHLSRIVEKSVEMLREVAEQFPKEKVLLSISGSAGMGLAERSDIQFVQEVYATRIAVNRLVPGTDAVIELGGEDAKILFLTDGNNASGLEVRMNGSCAGGTGAFIDQMATLLNITPDALNTLSKEHEKIYTIASRCGVFASGRAEKRRGGKHSLRRCEPDRCGSCAGQRNRGQGRIPRRPDDVFKRAARGV